MLRAIWFLLKTALLVGLIVWLAEQPGTVEILWRGYAIETSVGFSLAVLLAGLVLWTLAYRFWHAIVNVPAVYRRYRHAANREKGYIAVTRGLVAIAAGDARNAEKFSGRAKSLIPEAPLTQLLEAQSRQINGDAAGARRAFAALLEDETAAFFGLRGLLADTLREGNFAEALQLARKADKMQPKRLWVLRTLFDLETRNRNWKQAEKILARAARLNVFPAKEALHHKQALLLASADEAFSSGNLPAAQKLAHQAFALDPAYTPAALRLCRAYLQADKRHKTLKTILKAWQANPHPDLAEFWARLKPQPRKATSPYDVGRDGYLWIKQLHDLHPQHHDSLRALGTAALEARLWREARDYLLQAQDYRQLAKLEQIETGNEAKAREWLEIAAESPADPKWVCDDCGYTALDWAPLCHRCGSFNRAQWVIPAQNDHNTGRLALTNPFHDGLITPPAPL